MNYVAGRYEDMFPGGGSLQLAVWYDERNPGVLATTETTGYDSNGFVSSARIMFDHSADGTGWSRDSTPENNNGYSMHQTLWRDLSPAEKSNYYRFGANVPQTFEAGFSGSSSGGDIDLLSVAFHEVGHALALNNATPTRLETLDNDYDFAPENVFGKTLAAWCATTDVYHLQSSFSMMKPGIGEGERFLPSHTDLFAIAKARGMTLLDVPRREFYGGTDWNTAANWSGNAVPGSDDEAFVRASGPNGETRTAGLNAAGQVGMLHVLEGSSVETNAFQLSVFTAADIGGAGTQIVVASGGTFTCFSSGTLTVHDGARLILAGGQVAAGTITSDQLIVGHGTITFDGGFSNSGSIAATAGAMTINPSGAGLLDLDGSGPFIGQEPGDVIVTSADSDLVINSALADDFNSVMTIGPANSVRFNRDWTLGGAPVIGFGSDGVVNLNGGTTSATAAVLSGANVTVEGDINTVAGNYGLIGAHAIFTSGTQLSCAGTIELGGGATFSGGSYTGSGRLVPNSNVVFAGNTTIDVATLDLDGLTPGDDTLTVNAGAVATLNSTILDAYDDTMAINGSLIVNDPSGDWQSSGTVNLSSGTIGGSATLILGSGVLNAATGISTISASTSFLSTNANTINGWLRLTGNSTISGGTWSGAGTLEFNGASTTFTADTTLNVGNLRVNGVGTASASINVNTGVTVTSNGLLANPFRDILNINNGTFIQNQISAWTNAGTVNLNGSSSALGGQALVNDVAGLISGSGTIVSANLTNNGTISGAGAGTLTISTSTFPELDGAAAGEDGTINALAGSVHLTGARTTLFLFDGDLNIGAGRFFVMDSQGLQINPTNGGRIDFTGGTYQAQAFAQNSTLTVNSAVSTLGVGTYVFNSGTNMLTASLVLNGVGTINAAAQFGGAGDLVVPLGKTLNLVGANAGVDVQNTGLVQTRSGSNHVPSISGTGETNVATGSSLDVGSSGPVTQGTFTVAGSTDVGNVNTSVITSVLGGGTLVANYVRGGTLALTGLAQIKSNGANAGTSKLVTLTITGGATPVGTLDLNNNDLVVGTGTTRSAIEGWVANARHAGAWDRTGITSTTAHGNLASGLGVLSGAQYTSVGGTGTFSGQAYGLGDTLVKYTWNGDANLSGTVTFDDYVKIDTGFNQQLTGWLNGDFNYSGSVTFDDYVLIDIAFNQQNGTLARAIDWISGDDRSGSGRIATGVEETIEHFGQFGLHYGAAFLAAVPEPGASLVTVALGVGALTRKRRCGRPRPTI